jgi:hypothetical protein
VTGVGCFEILIILFFPHSFPCHSTFQYQLVCQSCPAAQFLPYLHILCLNKKKKKNQRRWWQTQLYTCREVYSGSRLLSLYLHTDQYTQQR